MMKYLVVAAWDEDNVVIAENRAETEERAIELQGIMVSEGHPEAFYVDMPTGDIGPLVVDPVAKTVIRDEDIGNADLLAENLATLRRNRNTKLTESDWTQGADSPLSDEVKAEWAVYREELRDLPDTTDDPADPTWPEV
jgi:hypothetical protein